MISDSQLARPEGSLVEGEYHEKLPVQRPAKIRRTLDIQARETDDLQADRKLAGQSWGSEEASRLGKNPSLVPESGQESQES